MPFHPHLMFGGNCREAFTRHREIFGGDLMPMPMSEAPEGSRCRRAPATRSCTRR